VYAAAIARRGREGLTWRRAAAEAGIPLPTLTWWRRRLQEEEGAKREGSSFVELASSAGDAVAERIEVVLLSGRRLLVPHGPPPAGLVELVRLLERSC
jgi:transposase-like protein